MTVNELRLDLALLNFVDGDGLTVRDEMTKGFKKMSECHFPKDKWDPFKLEWQLVIEKVTHPIQSADVRYDSYIVYIVRRVKLGENGHPVIEDILTYKADPDEEEREHMVTLFEMLRERGKENEERSN